MSHTPVIHNTDDITIQDDTTHRSISLTSGTFLVIGSIIGSGIFSTPALVLQQVGSPGMSVLLWAIGGLICLFGTLAYVEWGLLTPKSGGEKAYLDHAFPHPKRLASFAFCFTSMVLIRPGACAADAIVAGSYVMYAIHGIPKHEVVVDEASMRRFVLYEKVIAVMVMVVVTMVHLLSVRMALRVQNITGWIKLVTLMGVVVCGLLVVVGVIVPNYGEFAIKEEVVLRGWWSGTVFSFKGYADALFAVFFTVDGWNNLNYSVEELRDPARNLPLAAIGGTAISLVLFVLANMAYFSVLPVPLMLMSQQIVGADFFRAIFGGGWMDRVVPVLIALSTIGAISCMTFSASRLIRCVAQDQVSVKQGEKLHVRAWVATSLAYVSASQTPVHAILLHFVLTLAYILGVPSEGAYKFLVEATGYGSWVFYGLAVYGLLWLRIREPQLERKFKVFWPAAALFVLAAALLSVTSWLPGVLHDSVQFWVAPCVAVSTIALGTISWLFLAQ
jgi:amino acid transporter